MKKRCLIFDLSEVFISGLHGLEGQLSELTGTPFDAVMDRFAVPEFHPFLKGSLYEDTYLQAVKAQAGWNIPSDELKTMIRENFKTEYASIAWLPKLKERYRLILLSDHADEWVASIKAHHGFLEHFERLYFSCEIGQLKRHSQTFTWLLNELEEEAANCIFIDDRAMNIRSAKSVGIDGVRFDSIPQAKADLKAKGIIFD